MGSRQEITCSVYNANDFCYLVAVLESGPIEAHEEKLITIDNPGRAAAIFDLASTTNPLANAIGERIGINTDTSDTKSLISPRRAAKYTLKIYSGGPAKVELTYCTVRHGETVSYHDGVL